MLKIIFLTKLIHLISIQPTKIGEIKNIPSAGLTNFILKINASKLQTKNDITISLNYKNSTETKTMSSSDSYIYFSAGCDSVNVNITNNNNITLESDLTVVNEITLPNSLTAMIYLFNNNKLNLKFDDLTVMTLYACDNNDILIQDYSSYQLFSNLNILNGISLSGSATGVLKFSTTPSKAYKIITVSKSSFDNYKIYWDKHLNVTKNIAYNNNIVVKKVSDNKEYLNDFTFTYYLISNDKIDDLINESFCSLNLTSEISANKIDLNQNTVKSIINIIGIEKKNNIIFSKVPLNTGSKSLNSQNGNTKNVVLIVFTSNLTSYIWNNIIINLHG